MAEKGSAVDDMQWSDEEDDEDDRDESWKNYFLEQVAADDARRRNKKLAREFMLASGLLPQTTASARASLIGCRCGILT